MSQRDSPTLENPTRRKPSKSGGGTPDPPVEVDAWEEEARMASLMQNGFTYSEAFHMSPRDYRRYSGIFAAWSIPASEREEGARAATNADIRAEFATG